MIHVFLAHRIEIKPIGNPIHKNLLCVLQVYVCFTCAVDTNNIFLGPV